MQTSRIDKIIAYKERSDKLKAEKEQLAQEEYTAASGAVKELAPRIKELLEVANACEENGISIVDFIADEGYPIGFLPPSLNSWMNGNMHDDKTIHALGRSEKDEIIKGENGEEDKTIHSYFFVTASSHGLIKEKGDAIYAKSLAPTNRLIEFAEAFEKFEQGFYSYVDRIVAE